MAEKTKKILFDSYVNILLVFVPVGLLAGFVELGAIPVFVTNFLAIVPLAALLGFATEELATEWARPWEDYSMLRSATRWS